MPMHLRGVYLITPDIDDSALLLDRTRAALEGGLALLQYRNKSASTELRHRQASLLLELCRSHSVPLIVNDDLVLARRIGADGVHLGGEDGCLTAARAQLGAHALVGASCYASLDKARRARQDGASYVAFGAFAASVTKPDAVRAHPELLTEARGLHLPLVAIGGITPMLAPSLVDAGADLLAVITTVYSAPDPGAAVRALRAAFPEFQGES